MLSLARTRNIGMVLAVGCSLLLFGCSDDDDGGPVSDASVSDDSAVEGSTIAELAAANEDFSTLVAALTKAGLVDTLGGAGPFTVFAPNNQAFTDSGITSLDDFTASELEQILLYHVISGTKVGSSAVAAGAVESAAELTFFVGTDGGVTLNGGNAVTGGANVVDTDIDASNGVIHVIDRVILPPDVPTCAVYGGLTSLLSAVGAAGPLDDADETPVAEALKSDDLTVFAPTNDAFAALEATPEGDALRDVLLYHVLGAKVPSSAIPPLGSTLLKNRFGNELSVLFDTSSGVKVNESTVVIADVKCTNGIVHVVDKVLLPPNVVDMARIAGLTTLLGAVGDAADLEGGTSVADALAADEPYTVFAPTNDAFAAITVPTDTAVLRDVLLLHVVKAEAPVLSSGLPSSATTLNGQDVAIDASGPTVSGAGNEAPAAIGPADINVTNGVVHLIDAVLLPGS